MNHDELHIVMIEMGDGGIPDELMKTLTLMRLMGRLESLANAAKSIHAISRRAVEENPTREALLAWATHMLTLPDAPKDGSLTPEIMADRTARIAALPHGVEVTDDGSLYAVNLLSDNVWEEVKLPDTLKAGLAKAKLNKAEPLNRRPT
jgi:hypothetical protein